MKTIRVINGPNLNMLGIREPDIYGKTDYKSLCEMIENYADVIGVNVQIMQSNHEGDLVDWIQESYKAIDGIIINPAAYTHTSIAIRDAILAVQIPTVEIHLSNVHAREEFRRFSYTAPVCIGQITGFGKFGYTMALQAIHNYLKTKQGK